MKTSVAIIVVLLTALCITDRDGLAAPRYVKVATALPPSHPTVQALAYFQTAMEQTADDQFHLQIFSDAQLGAARDILQGVQFGTIEIGVVPSEWLAALDPSFLAISMPYIYRDEIHRLRVWDSTFGVKLLAALESVNLVGLGFFDTGMKNFVTIHKPLHALKEFQGMKIAEPAECSDKGCQTPVAEMIRKTLTLLGAVVAPVKDADVFQAMQSGEIDGWQGDESECRAHALSRSGVTYFTADRQTAIPDVLIASRAWFATLSPDEQERFRNAAQAAVRRQRQLWKAYLQGARTDLESAGVTLTEPTDRAALLDAVQPVYAEMYAAFGEEFRALIETMQGMK